MKNILHTNKITHIGKLHTKYKFNKGGLYRSG